MGTEAPLSVTSSSRGKPGGRWSSGHWLAVALLPLAALLRAGAFAAPGLVERYYSQGMYPWVSSAISTLTGRLSFSVAEVAVAAGAVALAFAVPRWLRGAGWRLRPAPRTCAS